MIYFSTVRRLIILWVNILRRFLADFFLFLAFFANLVLRTSFVAVVGCASLT